MALFLNDGRPWMRQVIGRQGRRLVAAQDDTGVEGVSGRGGGTHHAARLPPGRVELIGDARQVAQRRVLSVRRQHVRVAHRHQLLQRQVRFGHGAPVRVSPRPLLPSTTGSGSGSTVRHLARGKGTNNNSLPTRYDRPHRPLSQTSASGQSESTFRKFKTIS